MLESIYPISAIGIPIKIRPIRRNDLGKVLLRCLPDGYKIESLFKTQEIIGFGGWEDEKCIAQLHCYRLNLPDGSADNWPEWTRPAFIDDVLAGFLNINGSVWCHACFHVGRSIRSFQHFDEPDFHYLGRGIGTALCQASVRWAKVHNYKAVLAPGTPDKLFEFSMWAGGLPWTTYQKLGFIDAELEAGNELPEWIKYGIAPPAVMREVAQELAEGRPKREFHSRLMVLNLLEDA